jgi:hypothetical protein
MSASDDRHQPTRQRAGLTSGALSMLTREVGRAGLLAVTTGLSAWEQTRGLREMALRRADEVLQIVAHTPLGRFLPHPLFDDNADVEAERIASAAKDATQRAVSIARGADPEATPAAPPARPCATGTKTTPPRPADAPPPAAAVEAGAPGVVSDEVEAISEQMAIEEPTSRDELPIPDFDNISLGSLRARLRSLSLEQLVTLREWEKAHAHRLPVVTLLDNRIAKVSAEDQRTNGASAYPAEDARTSPARPASSGTTG